MMTSKISTGIRGTSPHTPFGSTGLEKDAAAWANLLDDWLGPDSDVYSRLPQRPAPQQHQADLSS